MTERHYPERPWVGIGCVVLRGEDVLLVRRARPPLQGSWTIPGGAQSLGETMEETARRELREEAGIEVGPLSLAVVVDVIDRDEAGRIRFQYSIVDFCARWLSGALVAGDDASEARFFSPAELESLELWNETRRAIAVARQRLAER
ncbi:NUDIX hydrolase [Roseomonas elaeocarpi]|uniref:NUDIX hydrolase n=1 Tax=Roseomonas elaeocarpi TaxID=907779 RepID=A0ABV6K1T9_9PROT